MKNSAAPAAAPTAATPTLTTFTAPATPVTPFGARGWRSENQEASRGKHDGAGDAECGQGEPHGWQLHWLSESFVEHDGGVVAGFRAADPRQLALFICRAKVAVAQETARFGGIGPGQFAAGGARPCFMRMTSVAASLFP